MTLLQLTLKNLSRRRVRTALTIMGIGLGIGAVVALLGLAWGLEASWTDAYKVRKTDLVVRRSGGGLIAQPFPGTASEQVAKIPGVSAVSTFPRSFSSRFPVAEWTSRMRCSLRVTA